MVHRDLLGPGRRGGLFTASQGKAQAQAPYQDHHAGRLRGDVAALAEGNAHGGSSQGGGVVDAVAQEHGVGALGLPADHLQLLLGRLARVDLADADLLCGPAHYHPAERRAELTQREGERWHGARAAAIGRDRPQRIDGDVGCAEGHRGNADRGRGHEPRVSIVPSRNAPPSAMVVLTSNAVVGCELTFTRRCGR